ncbi:hypothetical protein SLEP1_g41325 [Rubroshorea leprosula]|uniref:Retroviral polymerase SH3-like domain-containing protein n=1 Tax=Rubroshorea leprosula TaxID=152421 RepID=A0AAV5L695_9ROSI|nr:hypothetical protein SLEP1_g41325 [Rubroshorea leprosula]
MEFIISSQFLTHLNKNGVSERKNRSILNMARCLLFEKNLPKNFWAEAVYTSVHLQNRLPTKAIEGKTPFEAWSGNKPAVDHLKVFGCICYVFILDEKRGKLDERANTCVFIGYSLQSKGYRVFNLKTQKIEVCRSAKFDESAAWDWEKSQVKNSDQVAKLNDKPELEVDFDDAANESDLIDDAPVRGTRTLEDIYSRCYVKLHARVYRSMIGSLLYLSAPDIMHAVSLLSRFMHSPTEVHLKGVKRIFRYLKATAGFGVFYPRAEKIKLLGFCDSDWAGSEDDMKSTTGFCFTLGSGVISWCSQKQDALAHSIAEAEYIAAAIAVDQAIWLRKLLVDVHHAQSNPTEMLCDSKVAVAIAKNPVFHGKTKHLKLKYHIVRVAENDGDIVMVHCSSEENVADIFTKGLQKIRFEAPRNKLGVCSLDAKEEC